MKAYVIVKERKSCISKSRGTVKELTSQFGYTLAAGHEYNKDVNVNPRTARSLVANLKKAVRELEGTYELVKFSIE